MKNIAASENRFLNYQILFLVREYLGKKKHLHPLKTPAQILLELSGSWKNERGAEQIIAEIKNAREKSSSKLVKGFYSQAAKTMTYLLVTPSIFFLCIADTTPASKRSVDIGAWMIWVCCHPVLFKTLR